MIKQLAPIPNVIGGILCGFIAILGVRVTYPIANTILGLFNAGIMKTVAILVMWLVYVFVLWVMVWAKFFQPKLEAGGETHG